MINRILVKTEPSRATKIEIKRIIDAHNAKPKPQRQCQVCGTWIEQGDICCDETDNTPFTPVTDNEIHWDKGKEWF